jgi:hypothetical protein
VPLISILTVCAIICFPIHLIDVIQTVP